MIPQIIKAIHNNRTFLITAHIRLDGDALGSELALYHLLESMGKTAVIYNQDPVPGNYLFLPGSEMITQTLTELDRYDAVFILDCSELDRIGADASKIGAMKQIINIDHHISNDGFCDIKWIEPHASSTGELIYRLIESMGVDFSVSIATNLYTAILTDTGGFRYGNTTKDALMIAGRLAEKGADPQWISKNIYESNPQAKIRLLSKALQTLTYDENAAIASMVIYQQDLDDVGAREELTDSFVDLPRTVEGTMISIFYLELAENRFKVSLRSKDKVNVERVARSFGGGGHVNAAACRMEGTFDAVKRRMLDEVRASQIL